MSKGKHNLRLLYHTLPPEWLAHLLYACQLSQQHTSVSIIPGTVPDTGRTIKSKQALHGKREGLTPNKRSVLSTWPIDGGAKEKGQEMERLGWKL